MNRMPKEVTMNDSVVSLDDLIREGVRIRAARLAEERRRKQEEREHQARAAAEAAEAAIGLLPEALRPLAEVDYVGAPPIYVRLRIPIKSGVVKCRAELINGTWSLTSDDDYYRRSRKATFDAWNPDGYYQQWFTLEEAVAFAAGEIAQ